MIVFDGVSLDSVAKVDIEDIRVSPIDYDEITRPRAVSPGSVFVRSRAGTRTVAVTFALLDMNRVNRQKSLMAISEWAKNDKEYRLDLPGHPEHYLMATCTGKPEPSLRQWWESKLRLVFTCFENPFWNALYERSSPPGTQFTVYGDAPPLMRIERTVTARLGNATFALDGRVIKLTAVDPGQLVIDLNRQTITLDGSSDIMSQYQATNQFLIPRTGTQSVTAGGGTVYWRERWQ